MAKEDKKQASCQMWQSTYDAITMMMDNFKANTGVEISRIACMDRMRMVASTYDKRFQKNILFLQSQGYGTGIAIA